MKRTIVLISALLVVLCFSIVEASSPNGKATTTWGDIKAGDYSIISVNSAPPINSCVKLDVYFIPQLPPGTDWKLTKNCGQASVLNCVGYLKRACFPYTAITDENKWLANTTGDQRYLNQYGFSTGGTRIGVLGDLARGYWGYKNSVATTNSSSNIDVLYNELKAGRPIVVEVMTNMASSTASNDNYHFMVLVGMRIGANDLESCVWVNDVGKTFGKNYRYSLQQFKKSWATSSNHCVFIR